MRVRHYELIRELDQGGQGTLFLARDTRLGRRVMLQFPPAHLLVETLGAPRCQHAHLLAVHEVGQHEGCAFLVREYVPGQSLRELLHRQRLTPARALELMVPVVRALACAHAQGLVHRDLKPDTLLLTDREGLKVLDLGLTPRVQGPPTGEETTGELFAGGLLDDDGQDLLRPGRPTGSLAHLSPEQWGAGAPVDHLTDIWAVGVLLFQMVSGQPPLSMLEGADLAVTARLDEPMPGLRSQCPSAPEALAAVVDRCLRKRKEERFPDALALLAALEPLRPVAPTPRPGPYPGPVPFQEADAERFFGRAREVAALVQRLREEPLLAIAGPSGSGKTSLVRAGLVPALRRSGGEWEAYELHPGPDPLLALARLLEPELDPASGAARALAERLRTEPGHAGSVLRERARKQQRELLLFVDAFEELGTRVTQAEERRAFTACLEGIADDVTSPLRVVIALRSDALERMARELPFLAELSRGVFFLPPLPREALREALARPAEDADRAFETPALADVMVEQFLASANPLPLLQLSARQLWWTAPQEARLTHTAYEALGGISGALATYTDGVLASLTESEHVLARDLLLRLAPSTHAPVPLSRLCAGSADPGALLSLVEHLLEARLLVTHATGEGTAVGLVHESLTRDWPSPDAPGGEAADDVPEAPVPRAAWKRWLGPALVVLAGAAALGVGEQRRRDKIGRAHV